MVLRPTLESLLVERGLLTPGQVEHLQQQAAEQKKSLDDIIQAEQLVYPEPLAQLRAEVLGLPYVDLTATEVDPEALRGVSMKAISTYQFVPFRRHMDTLHIAMAAPADLKAQEAARFVATQQELKMKIYVTSPEAIEQALNGDQKKDRKQILRDFGKEVHQATDVPSDSSKLQAVLVEAPINKIVAVIVRHGIDGRATDIHIEPGHHQIRVRYRIDGKLHTTLLLPMQTQAALASRIKILAGLKVASADLPQEGRFMITDDQSSLSIRATTMPTVVGERLTLHITDTSNPPATLTELGMSSLQQELVAQSLHGTDGLIVVSGRDKTSTTTTLLSTLWEINSPDSTIVTLQNPVDVELPDISQTQIQPARGLTYAAALASTLRQDINIIMVEELFDTETADLVVQAASSGRRMVVGMSAGDAAQTLQQLHTISTNPYLLANALRVLVVQHQLPKLCQACKEPVPIPRQLRPTMQAELKKVSKKYLDALDLPTKHSFYESQGCAECQEQTTQGHIMLFEVVSLSQELRATLSTAANSNTESIRKRLATSYPSLHQDGILKALQGLVRYTDVAHAVAKVH